MGQDLFRDLEIRSAREVLMWYKNVIANICILREENENVKQMKVMENMCKTYMTKFDD